MALKRENFMSKQHSHYPAIAFAVGALLFSGLAVSTLAQSQDSAPSVADAARRAREQKKETAKPARTFTNDNLPVILPAPSNQETAPINAPPDTDQPAAPTSGETNQVQPAPENDEAKQKKAENVAALARAKKDLAQATSELDVLTRKAALDADSYYSKTGFANDKEGKANLDAEAQQINDKKEAVEALKARVTELQELVGEDAATDSDKNPPPSGN
jgi:hypothetical protein